jgi:excisionase family DNA binding protein
VSKESPGPSQTQTISASLVSVRSLPYKRASDHERPAFKRRPISRLATHAHSNSRSIQTANTPPEQLSTTHDCFPTDDRNLPHAVPTNGTSKEANRRVADPAAVLGLQETPHSFEPLIGSYEAARLLGNIHVKTLQRYARDRQVPGYQIGGHWYFRASELDSWLQSRINLSCHPCRLQEKSDGT